MSDVSISDWISGEAIEEMAGACERASVRFASTFGNYETANQLHFAAKVLRFLWEVNGIQSDAIKQAMADIAEFNARHAQ